ncbi:hypothetical protein KW429_11160 [Vibrio fluvialis]|nr:hypothetical protein [Vibrio fluvialis]MBY7902411.1 hypothetical protein [Vibrio fluvialis]
MEAKTEKVDKLMFWKNFLVAFLLAIPTGIAWASGDSKNPFDDGNTLGMAVLRAIDVLIMTFQISVGAMMLVGMILVASGIVMWAKASKLQISPSTGIWTAVVGCMLCSPMGCSAMASNQILKQPAKIFTELGTETDTVTANDYIQPNR